MCKEKLGSSSAVASNTTRAHRHIVVPEGIGSATIGFPAKVNARDLGNVGAPRPLSRVGIGGARLDSEAGNGITVEPCLDSAVGAKVVLEALPGASRQRLGAGDALGRKIREGGVVRLAVVHQDGALAADAEVLVGSLGGVELGDEGDVVRCQSLGGSAGGAVSMGLICRYVYISRDIEHEKIALVSFRKTGTDGM